MNYGIPYMGSKSKICENVCGLFPKAENLYDLFGGGFSITHFMLKHRSKDFKHFHFNEIRPGVCDLIKDAINGNYNYNIFLPKWVSREDFLARKESEPYIKIIWSFGNDGETYLFGKDIEESKKSMHLAIVFNEFDSFAKEILGMEKFRDGFGIKERRLFLRSRIKSLGKDRLDLQRLDQLQQLLRLDQLQQLQQLLQLERLSFHAGSYAEIEIKENSIIYCDIPYKWTADYGEFSHDAFFEWAHRQAQPVFISEYNISDSRFKCIANYKKISMKSANKDNTLIKTEKVYVNEAGYRKLMARGR
jgi:site-specific DNA-adenine methylase